MNTESQALTRLSLKGPGQYFDCQACQDPVAHPSSYGACSRSTTFVHLQVKHAQLRRRDIARAVVAYST